MNIDSAIKEWSSKNRRMGCVAATKWFCNKVKGFYPLRINRWLPSGDYYQHVVATNGKVIIDVAPYADKSK